MKKKNITGLAFDSILIAFTKIITLFLGIFTTKILSSFFSLNDYGTYSQSLIVVETATALITFGLTDAVNYFFNSNKIEEERISIINTIFLIEIILGVISIITILALSKPICMYFENDRLFLTLFIVCFQPVLDNLIAMFQVLYVSFKKGKLIATRNLCISFLRLAIVLLGALLVKDINFVVLGFVVTALSQLILFWFWFRKIGFSLNPFAAKVTHFKVIFKFGFPLGIYILVNALLRTVDKTFLGYFLSTDDLAIYSNAAKVLPFDIISTSFATIIGPTITKLISNKDNKNASRLISNFISISFFSTVALTIGSLIFSKDLLVFLYDPKYLPGLDIFRVYILIDSIKFCSLFIVLMSFNKNTEMLIVSASLLAVNLVLDYMFYFSFGAIGCAFATLIVTLLNTIYMFLRSSKLLQCKLVELINFDYIISFVLVIGINALFFYSVYRMTPNFIPDIIKLFLLFSLYLVVCFLFCRKKIKRIVSDINRG